MSVTSTARAAGEHALAGNGAVEPRARGRLATALEERLRAGADEPVLGGRHARVVLDAGPHEVVTVTVDGGRLYGRSGAHRNPDTLICGTADTLVAVAEGRQSGIGAFLAGDLTVRGDLSLALALDGMFDPARSDPPDSTPGTPSRPAHWPRASLVTVRNIPTAYLESGPLQARHAVVLLHGLGATNASMLPLQWNLGADHRVIAPDLPGFGASGKPHARYDATWFCEWLTGFLDVLGIDRAVVVGNSMGGRISLELGMCAPHRCTGLVLLTPAPAFRRMRQAVPLVRLLRPEIALLGVAPPHRIVVQTLRGMMSDPERLHPAWYAAAADEFLRIYRSPAARISLLAAARQIYLDRAYGADGFWDRLPSLQVPSLFVWGEHDRLVPPAFARHVSRALPDATSIVLDDCGHVPQFEHPAKTAALVRGFLQTT